MFIYPSSSIPKYVSQITAKFTVSLPRMGTLFGLLKYNQQQFKWLPISLPSIEMYLLSEKTIELDTKREYTAILPSAISMATDKLT
jgi:hypothetical protein